MQRKHDKLISEIPVRSSFAKRAAYQHISGELAVRREAVARSVHAEIEHVAFELTLQRTKSVRGDVGRFPRERKVGFKSRCTHYTERMNDNRCGRNARALKRIVQSDERRFEKSHGEPISIIRKEFDYTSPLRVAITHIDDDIGRRPQENQLYVEKSQRNDSACTPSLKKMSVRESTQIAIF